MLAGAHDRGNDAGVAVDFANAVAAGVADIEMILGIESDVERQIEAGFAAGSLVAAVAGFTDAGEIVERSFQEVDAPDTIGTGLGKLEPPLVLIECGMMGKRDPGLDRPLPITGAPSLTISSKGFDITNRELQVGFHQSVAQSRLVSRVKLIEPAPPAAPQDPVLALWLSKLIAVERLPSAAEPLGLRLQWHPLHGRTS